MTKGVDRRWFGVVAVLGALVLIALSGTVQGDQPTLHGSLHSTEVVNVSGSASTQTVGGTLEARSTGMEARLEAETINLRIEWKEGYTATSASPVGTDAVRERGVDPYGFQDAVATFSPSEGTGHLLSLAETSVTETRSGLPGALEASSVENESLVEWGHRKEAGTTDVVGFYYTLEGAHVRLAGADSARVSGNFTLFVNNVTIEVTDSEEGTWSNWTGYRESEPDSPVGRLDNPAAKEFRLRVTTVNVTNGTLWVNATGGIDAYARQADASVDGVVSAPNVSGHVDAGSTRYTFDQDPLRLWGQGQVGLEVASPSGDRGASGDERGRRRCSSSRRASPRHRLPKASRPARSRRVRRGTRRRGWARGRG